MDDLIRHSAFYDFSIIHNRDPVTNIAYECQIMRDKKRSTQLKDAQPFLVNLFMVAERMRQIPADPSFPFFFSWQTYFPTNILQSPKTCGFQALRFERLTV